MDAAFSRAVEGDLEPSTISDNNSPADDSHRVDDDDAEEHGHHNSFVRLQSAPTATELSHNGDEIGDRDVAQGTRDRATYAPGVTTTARKAGAVDEERRHLRSRISRLLWGSDGLAPYGGCHCFTHVSGPAGGLLVHRRRCRCRTRVASALGLLPPTEEQHTAVAHSVSNVAIPSISTSFVGDVNRGHCRRRSLISPTTGSCAVGMCDFCVRRLSQRDMGGAATSRASSLAGFARHAFPGGGCSHQHCHSAYHYAGEKTKSICNETPFIHVQGLTAAPALYRPPVNFCVCSCPLVLSVPEFCRDAVATSPHLFFEPVKPGEKLVTEETAQLQQQRQQQDRSDSDEEDKPRPLQISDDGIFVDSNLAAERRRKLRASGDTTFTTSSAVMLADSISREMLVRLQPYEPHFTAAAPARPAAPHRGCSGITGNVSATHLASKFEEEQKRDPITSLRVEALLTAFSFFWCWQHYTRALSRAKRTSEANIVGLALKQLPISVSHVKWCLRLLLFSRKYGLYTWAEVQVGSIQSSPSSAAGDGTSAAPLAAADSVREQRQQQHQRFTIPVLSQTGQFHYYLPSLAALRRSSVSGNVIKEFVSLTASLFSLPAEDLKLLLGWLAHTLVTRKASCGSDDQQSLYTAIMPLSCTCCVPLCCSSGHAATNLPSEKTGLSDDPPRRPSSDSRAPLTLQSERPLAAAPPGRSQLSTLDAAETITPNSPPTEKKLLCSRCQCIVLVDVLRAHCCCRRRGAERPSGATGQNSEAAERSDADEESSPFVGHTVGQLVSSSSLLLPTTSENPTTGRSVVLSLVPDVVEFAAVDPPSYLRCSTATSVRLARRLYEWRSAVSLLGRQLHRSIVQMNGVVSDGPIPRVRDDDNNCAPLNHTRTGEESHQQTWDQLD